MRSMRRLALALLVGAPLSVATSDAAAATAAQSCDGQVIALMNHASGASGPSDNPQAAAGPGFFLGPQTSDGITTLRDERCS